MDFSFFGLTSSNASEFRINLFKQIHDIVFHGQGGYDWHTVYNMPRWLRLFTLSELETYYKKQKDSLDKTTSPGNSTVVGTDGKVNPSAFPKVNKSSYK